MVFMIKTWAYGKSVVSIWRLCVYDPARLNHFSNMRHQLRNVEQLQLRSHLIHKNCKWHCRIKNICNYGIQSIWIDWTDERKKNKQRRNEPMTQNGGKTKPQNVWNVLFATKNGFHDTTWATRRKKRVQTKHNNC